MVITTRMWRMTFVIPTVPGALHHLLAHGEKECSRTREHKYLY